ncbi:unnamed protein product [Cochlearia groenlandica]
MPSGAKKRKAAKKKQEQASSTTHTNLKSNDSRSKVEKESNDDENHKKGDQIEITDSSHDHDKSSNSSRSSTSSSSSSSSSSDDESKEVKETVYEVVTVPDQPVPIAGDAPFIGATANEVVENTTSGLNSEQVIEILPVNTFSEITDETRQANSGVTDTNVKENEAKTSSLPESKAVDEGSVESGAVVSHEEEAPTLPTHGVAQRTSWFSCCGLFDVATGSTR